MISIRYGRSSDQEGDLHLPEASNPPVACLLHGGFWRMPYGRDQMTAMAEALVARGYAVWNLEYRRLGVPGGGWPGTMDDVAAGIGHLSALAPALDLGRVVVAGHSAGGHLALWVAHRLRNGGASSSPVRIAAAIGLAPIADLATAHAMRVGAGVVTELMGGTPGEGADRYSLASPIELLPLGVRQLILHGTADDVVPIELSRRYARAARAAGDPVELVELEGTGHMEYLDPGSAAFGLLARRLDQLIGGQARAAC